MKRLKRFKLFEASQEVVEDILQDFKDKVQVYLQDEFDNIDFEVEVKKLTGFDKNFMISLWISSNRTNEHGYPKTFSVKEILPILENLNSFLESNGMELYNLISDTPNKPSSCNNKLRFKYDDVTKIYLSWF
jgi:hypothetical protein